MNQLIHAVKSEQLKLRHTLVLRLAFIAPLAVIALQFSLIYKNGLVYMNEGQSPWLYFTRQTFQFWALLMAPLFITLETALVAQLDHQQQGWKQLFALPIPRWTIYVAKVLASLVLLGLSTLFLLAGTLAAGSVLSLLQPGLGFDSSIPWADILAVAGIAYIGSILIIVLHAWVALYWANFVVAVGFGIVMTVAGMLIASSDFGPFYPWALSALAINNLIEGQAFMGPLLISIMGSVLIFVAGGWLFLRRDVL